MYVCMYVCMMYVVDDTLDTILLMSKNHHNFTLCKFHINYYLFQENLNKQKNGWILSDLWQNN